MKRAAWMVVVIAAMSCLGSPRDAHAQTTRPSAASSTNDDDTNQNTNTGGDRAAQTGDPDATTENGDATATEDLEGSAPDAESAGAGAADEPAAEAEATESEQDAAAEVGDAEGDAAARATEEEPGATTSFLVPTEPAPADRFRLVLPPLLYLERSQSRSITAVFPFVYSRVEAQRQELFAALYYRLRSPHASTDVVFPFFWSFRGDGESTLVIPPVFHRNTANGWDFGIAPLFATGRHGDATYTFSLPTLTLAWAGRDSAHTFIGPFWRIRTGQDRVKWGVFPFLWTGRTDESSYALLPPLFFRFTDESDHSALTIVPPFFHRVSDHGASWGLAPLFFHSHDEDSTSWTVAPLFHYSHGPNATRFFTLLGGYANVDGASTLITPLYQRHRGATELDAVAPFFFSWRDPREDASFLAIPPIFWSSRRPGQSTTLVLPFFGLWKERGVYTTWATPLAAHWESEREASAATWIFPNIQVSHSPTSSTVNIHPLVYSTSARTHRHFVFAPLYWDFDNYETQSRTTIVFPFFWRFRHRQSVETHIFPFVQWGSEDETHYWWNVLYGLVGYTRSGSYARMRLFWIPFKVDGPD